MLFSIKGKTVTVVGAARSGIAVANAIMAKGGIAQISEFKDRSLVEKDLGGLRSAGIAVECGGHTQEFILRSDFLVLSPGVKMTIPPVLWAQAAGIEVMGEIEFAYRLCPCPIIAVTGSNGKTTTVTLISQVLSKAGRRVVLCGNIGSPFSAHVASLNSDDIVVLEISSFQLESTIFFKPKVALWLNFTQNHLDRHKDLQEYFDAKKKIFKNQDAQDIAILNSKQPEHVELARSLNSRVVFFNRDDEHETGLNANQMAVLAVAQVMGVEREICQEVFASFKGVEHRQELVRTIQGVDYVNDSKSTTPEAGLWALQHFTKPLILICGGYDKHLEFGMLRNLVSAKVKKMIVIGMTSEQLRQTFEDIVKVSLCATLQEAVILGRDGAQPGDVVLLSPMCASFDMFNDFEHRGQVFKEIVEQLK